jgi:hypothetical protein
MSKGLIRSGNRRGVLADKAPAVSRKVPRPREPAVCRRCGSVFLRRTWRADRALTHDLLARASWTVCPACKEVRRTEGYGRVVIRGAYAAAHEEAIRRRVRNIAARARFTQPERRLVSAERRGPVLEVLTTSQKLAHRIVHELKKAFRGRAHYAWSATDGSLLATWERES